MVEVHAPKRHAVGAQVQCDVNDAQGGGGLVIQAVHGLGRRAATGDPGGAFILGQLLAAQIQAVVAACEEFGDAFRENIRAGDIGRVEILALEGVRQQVGRQLRCAPGGSMQRAALPHGRVHIVVGPAGLGSILRDEDDVFAREAGVRAAAGKVAHHGCVAVAGDICVKQAQQMGREAVFLLQRAVGCAEELCLLAEDGRLLGQGRESQKSSEQEQQKLAHFNIPPYPTPPEETTTFRISPVSAWMVT